MGREVCHGEPTKVLSGVQTRSGTPAIEREMHLLNELFLAKDAHCIARSGPIRLTTQSICCASTRMRPWHSALKTASARPSRPRAASTPSCAKRSTVHPVVNPLKAFCANPVCFAFVDQGRGTAL